MAIYAKQINPEYQESPLFSLGGFPEDINVFGNGYFKSYTSPLFDMVCDTLGNGELLDEWEDLNNGGRNIDQIRAELLSIAGSAADDEIIMWEFSRVAHTPIYSMV